MNIKILFAFCLASIFFIACEPATRTTTETLNSDRARDGLLGAVKAVLTDDLIIGEQNGKQVETQQASSTSIYDESGKRTAQTPYRVALPGGYGIIQHDLMFNLEARGGKTEESIPVVGGKWIKNYDERGHMTRAERIDASGKQLESLSVSYEFDDTGNWTKRATRRSNQENQAQAAPISEVSNRNIIYFNPSNSGERFAKIVLKTTDHPDSPIPPDEKNIDSGRTLFNQKCSACHGENGKSQTLFAAVMELKPEDLTGEKVRALSEGAIYSAISYGGISGATHAYKDRISDAALWQIALYSYRLSRNPSITGAAEAQQMKASASTKPPQTASRPPAEQRYQLKGKVIAIERQARQVTVEHEEIKGYMGAMTMHFPLYDEKTLGRLKKDDRIEATLVIGEGKWELKNVVIK